MNGYGKLRRSTDKRKVIVEFYLYLAATLTVIRRLINRARSLDRWPTRPPPADSADDHLPVALKLQAHLLSGRRWPGRCSLFAEASAVGATLGNTDTIVDSEAELAVLAMDGGRWAEAAEHLERALAIM